MLTLLIIYALLLIAIGALISRQVKSPDCRPSAITWSSGTTGSRFRKADFGVKNLQSAPLMEPSRRNYPPTREQQQINRSV